MDNPLVADTDLIVDFLRGRDPGAAGIDGLLKDKRLIITSVTAYELRLGPAFSRLESNFLALMAGRTLPLDVRAAIKAGEVASGLRSKGIGIGTRDSMIAGTCLRFGMPLTTRNRRHFERVPGLELVPV